MSEQNATAAPQENVFQDIQDMISKMDPQKLQEGINSISGMLSPEQMQQIQAALGGTNLAQGLKNIDVNEIQAQLDQNPQLIQQLQNVAKLKNIADIFKN